MALIPTVSWSETTPAGTDKRYLGDDYLRALQTKIREIIAVDHIMEASGQGALWGQHKLIHLYDSVTGKTVEIYNSGVDLYVMDGDGNIIQLTDGGVLDADLSGCVMLTGNQTVAGVKTFTELPKTTTAAPTESSQVVTKATLDTHRTADPIDHPDSSITEAKLNFTPMQAYTGVYSGDDNGTQAITGVGFVPTFLILWKVATSGDAESWYKARVYFKSSADGYVKAASTLEDDHGFNRKSSFTDGIQSFDGDGFTVTNNDTYGQNLNESGFTYVFLALRTTT